MAAERKYTSANGNIVVPIPGENEAAAAFAASTNATPSALSGVASEMADGLAKGIESVETKTTSLEVKSASGSFSHPTGTNATFGTGSPPPSAEVKFYKQGKMVAAVGVFETNTASLLKDGDKLFSIPEGYRPYRGSIYPADSKGAHENPIFVAAVGEEIQVCLNGGEYAGNNKLITFNFTYFTNE